MLLHCKGMGFLQRSHWWLCRGGGDRACRFVASPLGVLLAARPGLNGNRLIWFVYGPFKGGCLCYLFVPKGFNTPPFRLNLTHKNLLSTKNDKCPKIITKIKPWQYFLWPYHVYLAFFRIIPFIFETKFFNFG